ncbi:MAG TPA: DNA repair protein RecN [Bacteroidales bacterium]|jgi:DNA repair protein RecN (Recombination protein N)|nr:DNA repair protein RecN [Bacteroidales bacterium]HNR42053.1 DNA repair protein RecN [Bacteroidales bacterium]HPM18461.1 DNA repair protein RecN [Bacteroidales bacterium]HQG76711.1 DNA repair protein RecN [Bacteroidales bacterium]
MLVRLSVNNYVLIRELDLSLDKGLTIITGETGAGKSILLGALSLILGSRADTSVLLDMKEKCVVEGTFKIDGYDLEEFFTSQDLDYDTVAILRREISPSGKSRAFINDTPVNLGVMRELGDRLIDIHSQHQTLMLRNNSFQLGIIDAFASLDTLKDNYSRVFNSYRKLAREYHELAEESEKNKSDVEYYRFQLSQLEQARLKRGEQAELEKEQELLTHAEDIVSALSGASGLFSGEDGPILSKLREARNLISRIRSFIPEGESLVSRIDSAFIELDDLSGEIEKLAAGIEADPEKLKTVNDRLDHLYSLMQKHRVKDADELIDRKEQIERTVSSVATTDERLGEIEKELAVTRNELTSLADELSERRRSALPLIETRMTDMLKQLGMPNARFKISVKQLDDFISSGRDSADFMFSANRNTEPEDIARIASGGELSRVMLSLKSLMTRSSSLPTIIFDEIDSGVSGEVADKVGQILTGMGNYMQVVNITHLPQIASRGGRHFHIYKTDEGDSTITRIKLLSGEERILEVARLLSGSEVTETALRNARELISAGKNK